MRILVTRAEENAARSAARLSGLGHEAVVFPLTRIVPLAAALPAAVPFAAVLATSAHALHHLAADSLSQLADLALYAVGEETARAAIARGFQRVTSARGDAHALAAILRGRRDPPADVLYLAGRDRKRHLEAILTQAGYRIEVLMVYAAEELAVLSGDQIDQIRLGRIDAVVHYSRRSAEIYCRLIETAGLREDAMLLQHFCLSDDVAVPLRQLPARDIRVAARPDEEHLLAELAR
jgi:uroporphyrinogen-III synthase